MISELQAYELLNLEGIALVDRDFPQPGRRYVRGWEATDREESFLNAILRAGEEVRSFAILMLTHQSTE